MCGLIASNDCAIDEESFARALEQIRYRGVEEPAYQRKKHTFVGHVSLPLCSLDPKLYSQPKDLFAFTGEIFNYEEHTSSGNDVKLLQNLFFWNDLDYCLDQLHSMDGFWAIALIKDNKLIAINDYLSQKPIYYRTDLNVIASEPKALLEFAPTTTDELFMSNIQKWGYDPTGNTAWKEIKQMPPGSIYIDGQIETYWDWDKVKSCYDVRTGIYQAMKRRIHVARPLSLLLSGGLDSSIVYQVAKELGADVKVFHVENGESNYADLITTDRTNLNLSNISDQEAIEVHQSPIDLGSVKPQLALAKAIGEQGYNVVLTGDGADELFGGYRRSNDYDSQMSDIFCELPYYHLPKLDRTMMRHTIEVRSPFLAPYLVKYAMSLPHLDRTNKNTLKRSFRDEIPPAIIERDKLALKTSDIKNDLLHNTQHNINLFKELKL